MTLDAGTLEIIEELARIGRIGKRDVLRKILREVASGEIRSDEVVGFYRDVWSILLLDQDRMHITKLSWSEDLDVSLMQLSGQVHRFPNRSEIVRIVVAYVGVRSGIVKVRPAKAKRLELIKRETNVLREPQRTGKPVSARSAA